MVFKGVIIIFKLTIDNEIDLKLLELSDAEELFELIDSCRLYLKEWLPWLNGAKNLEDTKYFLEQSQKQYRLKNGLQAGIWYKGKIAGVIGFYPIDWSNRKASIGYWLGEGYQGKGIMTKSVKGLVDYGLKDLGLNQVEIRCAEKNLKSRAIPEKLGFINKGMAKEREWLYDHYVNHVIYAYVKDIQ